MREVSHRLIIFLSGAIKKMLEERRVGCLSLLRVASVGLRQPTGFGSLEPTRPKPRRQPHPHAGDLPLSQRNDAPFLPFRGAGSRREVTVDPVAHLGGIQPCQHTIPTLL